MRHIFAVTCSSVAAIIRRGPRARRGARAHVRRPRAVDLRRTSAKTVVPGTSGACSRPSRARGRRRRTRSAGTNSSTVSASLMGRWRPWKTRIAPRRPSARSEPETRRLGREDVEGRQTVGRAGRSGRVPTRTGDNRRRRRGPRTLPRPTACARPVRRAYIDTHEFGARFFRTRPIPHMHWTLPWPK